MGYGTDLAPTGHPYGDGQYRTPLWNAAPACRFCLHFHPQQTTLPLNTHPEDNFPAGQRPVLHWPLAGGLVNNGGPLELSRPSVILNGTSQRDLFVRVPKRTVAEVAQWDCQGRKKGMQKVVLREWTHLDILPGGRMEIALQ